MIFDASDGELGTMEYPLAFLCALGLQKPASQLYDTGAEPLATSQGAGEGGVSFVSVSRLCHRCHCRVWDAYTDTSTHSGSILIIKVPLYIFKANSSSIYRPRSIPPI